MPPKRLTLKTTHAQKGQRLDQVVADWLPQALNRPVSKAKVRKLVVAGAVYLNGKRVRIASKELQANATIDAYVDVRKLFDTEGTARDRIFTMQASHVLFEDEDFIVVDKPAGLPTQPTLDEARDNLFAAVKKFIATRDGVIDPYVGLHHRLDRDTSGVVLFTKRKEANVGAGALFSEHIARKTYNAITLRDANPGAVPRGGTGGRERSGEWRIQNNLGKASSSGKRAKFTAVRSGGDPACTEFKLLGASERAFWIEARPLTGRTHQIRVHLSEDGLPILGDPVYLDPALRAPQAPRLMLHAARLEFPHPRTNAPIRIESPLPADFRETLARLQLTRS